jgi:hypothetical protein
MVVLHMVVFGPTVEVTACARDGTTALGDKVTVGTHVRFNEDDDDADGGGTVQDKDDDDIRQGGVPKEDDLIKVHFTFSPGFATLETGKVVLKRANSKIRLWKYSYKGGAANECVFDEADETEKVYDLSESSDRTAFLADVRDKDAWVEGSVASDGLKDTGLSLIYRNPAGNTVSSDLVKFTVIRTLITVYGSDEATAVRLDKTDSPGAYLWYNHDDDDENNTEDRSDLQNAVTGENDLLKVTIAFSDLFANLHSGKVVIERTNTTLRLWMSKTKGANQELTFTDNQRAYDLSGGGRQDFLNEIRNKDLWLESYEPSSVLRDTGLKVIYRNPADKDVCRHDGVCTVLDFETTHVAFNVDRAGHNSEGMNIRVNYSAGVEIEAPEWIVHGAGAGTFPDKSDTAAYIAGRPVNVWVRFTVSPAVKSAELRAAGTKKQTGALSLGNLGATAGTAESWKAVAFAGGVSQGDAGDTRSTINSVAGYVKFTPQNTTSSSIALEDALCQFQIRKIGGDEAMPALNVRQTGQRIPHRLYTLLGDPQTPWDTTDGGANVRRQPWVDALKWACKWAQGKTDIPGALEGLTCNSFTEGTTGWKNYDGGPGHTDGTKLKLTLLLSDNKADCRDMSAILDVFAKLLGTAQSNDVRCRVLRGPFLTQKINPIGPLGWDKHPWAFHQVAVFPSDDVYDACAQLNENSPYQPVDCDEGVYKGDLLDTGETGSWETPFKYDEIE